MPFAFCEGSFSGFLRIGLPSTFGVVRVRFGLRLRGRARDSSGSDVFSGLSDMESGVDSCALAAEEEK